MRVLVTGATGFVGGAVVARALTDATMQVRAAVRRQVPSVEGVEHVLVGDLTAETSWIQALHGVDTVIHTAARVHVMHEAGSLSLDKFRLVNVDGTLALARQAVACGVRRFVFVSSIKVNGERTEPGRAFCAADAAAPVDSYGISKYEAEQALRILGAGTGIEIVIVRPVLVYGPGVGGNFRSLMNWLARGIPLPLGAIANARSLVAVGNLADLLLRSASHAAAPGQTFLVSDGEDLSTPDLLRRTARALGTEARLIPVPPSVLRTAARAIGKVNIVSRLCDSLQVDINPTRVCLGWTPPVGIDASLADTAATFQSARSRMI